jgi:ParB-like chromosome segregation protein Spo0J
MNRTIEFRPVDKLKRYERNARTHNPYQVAEVADAILEWGWTMPILIDEADGIIAGEGRSLAAKKLYGAGKTIKMAAGEAIPKGMVPVIVAKGWSEEQRRAYVLADNKIALNSGWDETILNFELSALDDLGFDIDLTGFHVEVDNTSATKEGAIIEDSDEAAPDEGRFWITLRGPLEDQARVLDAVKAALGEPGRVTIDIGAAAGPESNL